ncbi:hypothetical protein ACET3Z_011505 [Daucus carota]
MILIRVSQIHSATVLLCKLETITSVKITPVLIAKISAVPSSILLSALDRVSEATVEAMFHGLRYMFCYKELVNVLNSDIEKVNIQEERVSRKAAAARADGKTVEDYVMKWQKEVEEIQESAREFSGKYKNRHSWRCIQCLPIPKPVSRFQLGREAVQMSTRVIELTNSGMDLLANDIAHFPPFENIPKANTAFQHFQSRRDVYGELWEILVGEGSSPVIGIYGMPGVGKTQMVEQIWGEAKEKKIFDKITRADVGNQKLDVIKVLNQIAGYLNCHFESKDNVDHRASQLKRSLLNGGKILIILDDVWREIPLDIIGIPFGHGSTSTGSKIILTARVEEACLRNNCRHPVKITPLTIDEGWDMFKYTIGFSQMESLQDEALAKEVCNQCAGIPLVIHAVGKALQFMSDNSWKDALYQLKHGQVENIPGIGPEVYDCLKSNTDLPSVFN